MSGVDVDGFLSSQRAKLTEEKSRLRRCVVIKYIAWGRFCDNLKFA